MVKKSRTKPRCFFSTTISSSSNLRTQLRTSQPKLSIPKYKNLFCQNSKNVDSYTWVFTVSCVSFSHLFTMISHLTLALLQPIQIKYEHCEFLFTLILKYKVALVESTKVIGLQGTFITL